MNLQHPFLIVYAMFQFIQINILCSVSVIIRATEHICRHASTVLIFRGLNIQASKYIHANLKKKRKKKKGGR